MLNSADCRFVHVRAITLRTLRVILAAATIIASGHVGDSHAQVTTSLYARIGGETVVQSIVSETIDAVVADPRLNQSFRGTNIGRIKRLLAEQICDLAGGGCQYSGDTMREVHANHHITEAQFYGLVADLRTSMRRHHVGLRERNELLALLAPMKRDIVEQTLPPPQRND